MICIEVKLLQVRIRKKEGSGPLQWRFHLGFYRQHVRSERPG